MNPVFEEQPASVPAQPTAFPSFWHALWPYEVCKYYHFGFLHFILHFFTVKMLRKNVFHFYRKISIPAHGENGGRYTAS